MHVLTSLVNSLESVWRAVSLRDCCVIKKDVRIPTRTGRLQHSLQHAVAPTILMDVNINNILH